MGFHLQTRTTPSELAESPPCGSSAAAVGKGKFLGSAAYLWERSTSKTHCCNLVKLPPLPSLRPQGKELRFRKAEAQDEGPHRTLISHLTLEMEKHWNATHETQWSQECINHAKTRGGGDLHGEQKPEFCSKGYPETASVGCCQEEELEVQPCRASPAVCLLCLCPLDSF